MKSLKRIILIYVFVLCSSGISFGEMLGVEAIFEYPYLYTTQVGTTTYDMGLNRLTIISKPFYFHESQNHIPRFITPSDQFDPELAEVRIDVQIDNDGLLIGGVSGDDLVVIGKLDIDGDGVIDYNGVLLTAEIVEFGFHDTGGTIDYFDFRFRVTGGLLESRYNNKDVGLHLTSECSDFTGSFNVDFSGKAKGKLGAMPICCTGTIGDFIWHDLDRDGIQDAGESGIQGVTVRLEDSSGSPVADTSTGIDGFYEFTGLCAGDYTVVVDESTLPPGYIFTPLDQGGDDTVDNDGSPYTVTLPANDSNDPTVDFGFNYPCTGVIGDKVWYDVNRDGIQNAGESGLDRIEVKLKDSSGDVIALDVTDENGNYRFEGLCAGDYTVEVNEQTLPPGFIETPVDQGNDDTIDNDGSPAVVTLSDDLTEDLTIDFGYISPCQGSIGDFVWDDRNRDGIQDAGEPGINGVTVYLKDSSDMPIATTTTGSNGAYAFNGLCAGTYTVEVDESTLLPDFVATPVDQGGDDTVDSDPSPVSVTLTDDITDNPTLDFGYNSPCTGALGDLVWHDVNRDGIQDAGELGISGIKVILKDETGSVIGTATTDGNGAYGFTGLCSGTYTLEVDKTTLPPDFVATPVDQGGDDTVDSDPSPVSVILTDDITENPTLDFGYNSPCTGTLGDLVWHDVNRDGIQDAGELGIPGITVILKDDAGTIIATDSTDGSGIYGFTGLCAGTYRVEVDETTLPPDFVVTPVDQGGDDTVDSDPSPITVTLTDDITENPTLDFGYNSPCTGALGDLVWHDVNRDGIQDAGELGIPGITVILKDNAGTVIATESTDGSGAYGFTGLCAGTYTVEVDETTLPPDFVATPVDQGDDDTADSDPSPIEVILIDDDTDDSTLDFGYNSPCTGSLGDFVWHDANRDGIQDAGEPGLPGIKVNLKDDAGTVIATESTDESGAYGFTGLCAGTYRVEVDETTLPPDFVATPVDQGGDDTVDSDPSPVSVILTDDITENPTLDFGYNSPCTGALGDFVWHDVNRDGIQDAGELGIPGITVILKDDAGTVIATESTDGSGAYGFTGLCAGTYTVEVDETTLPPDFVATPVDQGDDDTADSDPSPISVTLKYDITKNFTLDFGYNSPCTGTLGDYVWHDLNRDGIQDSGESGLEGIKVILKDAGGMVIAEARTDPHGYYGFNGLCAGDYSVEVDETTLPPDFVATPVDQGGDDTADSDPSPVFVTLTNDTTSNPTLDFGYNSPCTGVLGDFVWQDENRNGIQDAGESGLEGIKVILKDAEGRVLAEVTTDADGFYLFPGLCAGEYKVAVDESTLPSGIEPSPCDVPGGDDEKDSDCSPVSMGLTGNNDENRSVDFGYMPEECGECEGKVTELTLKYNGSEAAVVKVKQKKEGTIFSKRLNPGDTFTITGADRKGTLGTEIYIYVGCRLNTKIHTSCSQPIGPGLVSGDFEVLSGFSLKGGKLCPVNLPPPDDECGCEGKVTVLTLKYNGSDVAVVKVKQKKEGTIFRETLDPGDTFTITGADKKGTLGTEIYIYVGWRLNTKIHTSCSKPIGPGLVSGDFEVLSGFSREGGELCPVNLPPPDDECGCEGKVTELTLKYNGDDAAVVKVEQRNEGTIFWRKLDPGDTFTITGKDKNGTLGTEIYIYVGWRLNTKIHTSCSKPIGPGLVSGDFEVLSGFSLKGGELCPL